MIMASRLANLLLPCVRAARPLRGVVFLVSAVVLVQLPFWIATNLYAVDRPLFNLDFLLALLVALVLPRLGGVALLAAWSVEIVRDVARCYHFIDTGEFVASARFLGWIELSQIVSWKLVPAVLALGACGWLVVRLIAHARPAVQMCGLLLGGMCLLVGFDAANGSNRFLGMGADRFRVAFNIAGSPGWNIYREQRAALRGSAEPMARWDDAPIYQHLREWKVAHPQGSEVLVLVESMGLPRSPALRDWLYARLVTPQIAARWDAHRMTEPFNGSTTYGELRVLCGLHGHYARLKPVDEGDCLPRLFVAMGQPAAGLHGFNLSMFERGRWWPQLGLQPQRFDTSADAPLRVACNKAFPGVCDPEVIERAAQFAERPGSFTYVVTLDTHLPLPQHDEPLDPELARRCIADATPAVACQMVQRLGDVMAATARALAGMHTTPMVAVVGDHAPPFVQAVDRDAFDDGNVAAMLLVPR